jgi:hypothetical protein
MIPTTERKRYLIPRKSRPIMMTKMGLVFARNETIAGFSVS